MAGENRFMEFDQFLTSGELGEEELARNRTMANDLHEVYWLKSPEFRLIKVKIFL